MSFVAEIHRLPERQTTDYLRKVLDMIEVAEAAEVGERIVVAYGDGQYLPLYIESAAARRLAESAQGRRAPPLLRRSTCTTTRRGRRWSSPPSASAK